MHEQGLNYLDSSMQPSTSTQLDTVGGLAADTNVSRTSFASYFSPGKILVIRKIEYS